MPNTRQLMMATAGVSTVNPVDTLVLLHMDGSNGGTDFPDATGLRTWTNAGAATTSTTQKKFGTASLQSDSGTTEYITSDSNIVLPSGNFTIECWIYLTTAYTVSPGVGLAHSVSGGNFEWYVQSGGRLFFYTNGFSVGIYGQVGYVGSSAELVTLNTWHHIATVLSGSVGKVYINGKEGGAITTDTGFPLDIIDGTMDVGRQPARNSVYGYMDEFRISKIARYTSNFTPSTTAFEVD